ncbi:hypothetical protein L2719_06860 [Shewanella schlegeliana]|uniref:Lipoprotein n=1 Tax=Shewanella schlegeliana TaxID=190308 RepID=A0ABS1T0E3_9GAMM|nr:hypothetical protein [Shewanella schlegeliana]MBL4913307.1 hypothetical protein [Shewanella schlegeliana]MCL1109262.1 hypothetical protein [Shewanella schlegeliana]GIU24619.1 hypothetical protein TUM4433_08490 [Shewanella schlegeliana]
MKLNHISLILFLSLGVSACNSDSKIDNPPPVANLPDRSVPAPEKPPVLPDNGLPIEDPCTYGCGGDTPPHEEDTPITPIPDVPQVANVNISAHEIHKQTDTIDMHHVITGKAEEQSRLIPYPSVRYYVTHSDDVTVLDMQPTVGWVNIYTIWNHPEGERKCRLNVYPDTTVRSSCTGDNTWFGSVAAAVKYHAGGLTLDMNFFDGNQRVNYAWRIAENSNQQPLFEHSTAIYVEHK